MNTGPLRSTLGPLKSNVTRHLDKVKNQLNQDRPKDDLEKLEEHIEKLHIYHDSLSTASTKLQNKLDEWMQLLQTAEDLHADEQDHYDRMCPDIVNLTSESDDLLSELNVRIHYCQSDLDRLEQAQHNKVAAPDQPQNAADVSTSSTTQQPGAITGIQSGPPVSHPVQTAPQTVPPPHVRAFKAPKLKLPTFSGDYKEFKQFWGIFKSTIHDDPGMNNIEKFSFLLSQLEGEAKNAIAGILITNDNYDVAVDLLKSRFDRADDRMVTLLYSELTRIPSCPESIADKQRTLDNCERIFRQLETAGEAINSNKALVITLLTKFPPGTVKDLQRYYSVGTNNTLAEVRTQLKSIMDEETTYSALDDLQSMQFTKQCDDQPKQQASQPDIASEPCYTSTYDCTGPMVFESSALAAINARNYNGHDQVQTRGVQMLTPPGACYFCGGHHFNNDCTKYTTAAQRTARLAGVNRCPRCMKRHDPRAPCPFRIKCIYCRTDNDHMTALCGIKYQDQPSSTIEISQPDPPSTDTAKSTKATDGSATGGITALSAEIKPALFQTAKTVAINPKTGQKHTLRLAMDTLSSRNYITDDAARKLGLTADRNERLNVSVFGSDQSTVVRTSHVQFDVNFRDGTYHLITANTTRIICKAGAVFNDWSDEEKKALSHVSTCLADDPFDNDGTIDVLIGSSLVWEFIDGTRCSTTAPSLFLIPSKFGLMLAGESEHSTSKPQQAMLCLTEHSYSIPTENDLTPDDTEGEFPQPREIICNDNPIKNDCGSKAIDNSKLAEDEDCPADNSKRKRKHNSSFTRKQRKAKNVLLRICPFLLLQFLFKLIFTITLLLTILNNQPGTYPADVDSTSVIHPAVSTVQSRPAYRGHVNKLPYFGQTITTLLCDPSAPRGWRTWKPAGQTIQETR